MCERSKGVPINADINFAGHTESEHAKLRAG